MSQATETTNEIVAREEHQIVLLERVRAQLAEARSIEDVLELRDQTSALQTYARKKKLNEESMRELTELQIRVQRRLGEMTAAMEKTRPGGAIDGKKGGSRVHGGDSRKSDALAAVGLTKQEASTYERLAAIPEERFEEEVKKPGATTRSLARVGGQHRPRRGGRKPQAQPQPAPRPSRANAAEWAFQRRAQMFRGHVEQLAGKVFEKWPAQVMAPLLTTILRQVADQLDERARRNSLA